MEPTRFSTRGGESKVTFPSGPFDQAFSKALCPVFPVECVALQQKCTSLQQDCDALRAERKTLTERLHHLEAELSRYSLHTELSCVFVCCPFSTFVI